MIVYFFPLLGAVLGYLTFKLVGNFIIKQIAQSIKDQLPKLISNWVNQQILQNETLLQQFSSAENTNKFKPAIEEHVDHFLNVKLQEKVPALAMFIGPPTIASIKSGLMEEIDGLLPKLMDQLLLNAKSTINIEELILKQLKNKTEQDITQLIRKPIQPYLSKFALLGVLFGGILGTLFLVLSLI